MIDNKLSEAEAVYFAGKVNVLITKLGGLLKFYSDSTNVHSLVIRKPLKLARVSKIAEYPVKIYTRGYKGALNITPYNIVKQLPRTAFTRDNVTAISVKVKTPISDPQQKVYYDGTAITYFAKNRPAKMIWQKPLLQLNKDKKPAEKPQNTDNDELETDNLLKIHQDYSNLK